MILTTLLSSVLLTVLLPLVILEETGLRHMETKLVVYLVLLFQDLEGIEVI